MGGFCPDPLGELTVLLTYLARSAEEEQKMAVLPLHYTYINQ